MLNEAWRDVPFIGRRAGPPMQKENCHFEAIPNCAGSELHQVWNGSKLVRARDSHAPARRADPATHDIRMLWKACTMPFDRHCERSEAIRCKPRSTREPDCFVTEPAHGRRAASLRANAPSVVMRGLARASTSSFVYAAKAWMARTTPGDDERIATRVIPDDETR